MPHLTLDYSRNLDERDIPAMLQALNRTLAGSGHFEEPDIKSRARGHDLFAIGTQDTPRAFLHLDFAILDGRDAATRSDLARQALACLEAACRDRVRLPVQISVEIREIERARYAKAVLG